MTENREALYLERIRRAAKDAATFVEGMDLEAFLADPRTQHACAMCLLIIGECASWLMKTRPDFVAAHPGVPWTTVIGMRNRIAHGYFEINHRVVWVTLTESLPAFLGKLPK